MNEQPYIWQQHNEKLQAITCPLRLAIQRANFDAFIALICFIILQYLLCTLWFMLHVTHMLLLRYVRQMFLQTKIINIELWP